MGRKNPQENPNQHDLIDYVNGKIKLEPAQVTAAIALMRKCLPAATAFNSIALASSRLPYCWCAALIVLERWGILRAQLG
jgi:hypothetical protein